MLSLENTWVQILLAILLIFTCITVLYFLYLIHLGNIAVREQEKMQMYRMQAGIERSTSQGMDELCSSDQLYAQRNQPSPQAEIPMIDSSPARSGQYKRSKILPTNTEESKSSKGFQVHCAIIIQS